MPATSVTSRARSHYTSLVRRQQEETEFIKPTGTYALLPFLRQETTQIHLVGEAAGRHLAFAIALWRGSFKGLYASNYTEGDDVFQAAFSDQATLLVNLENFRSRSARFQPRGVDLRTSNWPTVPVQHF